MMAIAVINLGLKSIRCIIFDNKGFKLGFSSRPVHTYLHGNHVEQDANEWLILCGIVVREAVKDAKNPNIIGVTFTTSASCLVPTDVYGKPIHPVIMVSDGRSFKQTQQLKESKTFRELTKKTKLEATTDLMIPKIMWVKENEPEIYAKTAYFFSPAEFLIYHFTNEAVIDVNNALKYHAYSKNNGNYTYDSQLLQELGLDKDKLPEIKLPGQELSGIKTEVAEDMNLPKHVRIVLATYDALCALIGSGVSKVGVAAVVSGTVTSVRTLANEDVKVNSRGILQSEWVEEKSGIKIVGGSNNLGGGLIEWHKQAFYYDIEGDPYLLMDKEASTILNGSEGLMFMPYLLGERAPVWDSQVRGLMFGMERRHSRPHFTKAVYESVAYSTRHILEYIGSNGIEVNEARFSGGLARSPVVSQTMANVLQIPVMRNKEFETTALGALIICLYTLSIYDTIDSACKEIIEIEDEFLPDLNASSLYHELFEFYKSLYTETKGIQDHRSRLMKEFEQVLNSSFTNRENL